MLRAGFEPTHVHYLYTYMYMRSDTIVCVAFNTAIMPDPIINALTCVCLCVTDQTREAVLHCGPGGGLAGEYFLIYPIVYARVRRSSCLPISFISPARVHNFVPMLGVYRTSLIAQFRVRAYCASINAGIAKRRDIDG